MVNGDALFSYAYAERAYFMRNATALEVIRLKADTAVELSPCVAAIGNFDGIHRGHQKILQKVIQKAQQLQLTPTVITFSPLPFQYLRPQMAQLHLSSFAQKLRLLADMGIERVIALRFDQALAKLQARDFIQQYLQEKFQVQHLVVGNNFRFGHQQQGDVKLLNEYSGKAGFHCEVVDLAPQISSTLIRQHLIAGDCQTASHMLGRSFSFSEHVVKGKGLASQWGIPTANLPVLMTDPTFKGIFVIKAHIAGQTFNGVANLGMQPTMDGKHYLLEAHLFDFCENVYGKRMTVDLLHKLRDEKRFANIDDLRQQIHQDIEDAKNYFKAGTV